MPTSPGATTVPDWAEKTMTALDAAARHGEWTDGEQQMLDYLWLRLRDRANLLAPPTEGHLPWDEVVAAVWRYATRAIEAERAQS